MDCREASHRLQLYIDAQLTMTQTRELEAHISRCPACREELFFLEDVIRNMHALQLIAEPDTLTAQIMRKIALTPQSQRETVFSPLPPSLWELIAVVVLATIATLGILLQQPSVRSVILGANGRDGLSLFFATTLHGLTTMDPTTLTLAFWIIGTLLGVCITLLLAGNEIRTEWFKAVIQRIPVR